MIDDGGDFPRLEAARRLRLSAVTVDRLVRSGELIAYHIGRRVWIRSDSIEAYLARCRGEFFQSDSNNQEVA